jgi:hypothetical protein
MLRIEYDGKPLDVDPDQLPGFYFALQDLIDLSALKGSRSTTMRLPATPQVRTSMGGVSMAEDEDGSFKSFRVMDGTAPVFSGVAKVLSRSRDEYEVVAIGDNAAWKDGAAALRLRELELGFTPDVDRLFQESTWYDEDSLVYFPLISYGRLRSRANSYDVQPEWLRPALRVWWLLKYGFAELGYTLEAKRGLLATHKKFVLPCTTSKALSVALDVSDAMVMAAPCCGAEFGSCQPPQNTFSYNYVLNLPNDTTPAYMTFSFVSGQGADYASPGRYVATADGFIAVSMRALWGTSTDLFGVTVNYSLVDTSNNEVKATVSRQYYGSGAQDDTFVFPIVEVIAGRQYAVAMFSPDFDGQLSLFCGLPGGGGYVAPVEDAVTVLEGCEVRVLSNVTPYTTDLPLVIASAAPDITLLELLKWWTLNQNIVVRTDELTKHITLEYYDDFCRPALEGVDWTYRLDHTDPPRKVTDTLPKAYQFRFIDETNDEGINFINRTRIGVAPYGGHDHLVTNGQESPETVDIGFAPTAMDSILGGQIYVPVMHDDSFEIDVNGNKEDQYDWQPRLLYADDVARGRWIFDGLDKFVYPRCYFIWPEPGRANISFGNEAAQGSVTPGTVATRWRDRLRRSTAPALEGFMRLYDHELLGFEFGRPVSINDGEHTSWLYVIAIKRHQFLADATTEVKLVRM